MRGISENFFFFFLPFRSNAKVALLQGLQKHIHDVTDEGVHKTDKNNKRDHSCTES
jgi:hypothetical protein